MNMPTAKELREISPIFKQVVMPAQVAPTFNVAAPQEGKAVHTPTIQADNKASMVQADKGLKETTQSIKALDQVLQQADTEASPDNASGGNLLGRCAGVGISLATGGVVAACAAAVAGPAAATVVAGAGSLATFKDVASIVRDAVSTKGPKSETNKETYVATPSTNSFDYIAQQTTAPQPVGTAADISAFKGGLSRILGNDNVSEDLCGDIELSEQSLQGITTLKMSLEEQQALCKNTLQNTDNIFGLLNRYDEKAIPVFDGQKNNMVLSVGA